MDMDTVKIQGFGDVKRLVKESDYERCAAMEIIRVFDEDITTLTAEGAQVEYLPFFGSFNGLLKNIDELKRAEKLIVYTLQDPRDFDEEELDRMAKCLDTITAGRTAYALKMTEDYPPQFHIFMRIREDMA